LDQRRRPTGDEVKEAIGDYMARLAAPPYAVHVQNLRPGNVRDCALIWLLSQGYIREEENFWRLTPSGWDYWQQLQLGPALYWMHKNWFPATVAAATFLVGIGTIVAQVLD